MVRSLRNRNFVAIDPNGNTLSKSKNGATTEFLYDIRNQLGEVRRDVNVLGRYGYDSEGLRILKIGDEGRRQYTYDQLSVITEADQSNATVSKYDYGLDQLVRLDNSSEGESFFHLDILGSTVGLTEDGGTTRQSILYDAWGNERDRIGVSANRFTFTGHEKDEETDLIYAKARFYDTETGRFLTQDGLLGSAEDVPSLHRYSYVRNNPVFYVDPNGRTGEPVTTATTTAITVRGFTYVLAGGGGSAAAAPFAPVLAVVAAATAAIVSHEVETEAKLRVIEETAVSQNDRIRRRQELRRGLVILEDEDPVERLQEEQRRDELKSRGIDLGEGRSFGHSHPESESRREELSDEDLKKLATRIHGGFGDPAVYIPARYRTTAVMAVPMNDGSTRLFFSNANDRSDPRVKAIAEEEGVERVSGVQYRDADQTGTRMKTDAEKILLNYLESVEGQRLLAERDPSKDIRIAPNRPACGPSDRDCAGHIDRTEGVRLAPQDFRREPPAGDGLKLPTGSKGGVRRNRQNYDSEVEGFDLNGVDWNGIERKIGPRNR